MDALMESTSCENIVTPPRSVKIVDAEEKFLFDHSEDLAKALGCPLDMKLKTLAIVGNTGDGKSHTLNRAFCPYGRGDSSEDVFITSSSQSTCTLGVWAAFEPQRGYLLLDTEGLLGLSTNPNRQRRLLLKVFAMADVVVYRCMSDRLHTDMFTFLADASDAFVGHFAPRLEALVTKHDLPWSARQLGPAVVIFQETRHTSPLPPDSRGTDYLMDRLASIHRNVDAFSSLRYVGIQTHSDPTNFEPFVRVVDELMAETSVRAPRQLEHIFRAMMGLSTHFATDLPDAAETASTTPTFVEEYFTCPAKCTICGARCQLGVAHAPSTPHFSRPREESLDDGCQYSIEQQNKMYFCKACYAEGRRTVLVPKTLEDAENTMTGVMKYLWYGYLLRCPRHGVIYRSRAHWSGNQSPEDCSRIHWQIVHLWPGEKSLLLSTHPFGQLMVDSLTNVTEQVSQLAGPSTRRLGDLIADSLAPDYWEPNSSITNCVCCGFQFPISNSTTSNPDLNSHSPPQTGPNVSPLDDAEKHHCRVCGRGVCASCSKQRIPVPERGFVDESVRVCDRCYTARAQANGNPSSSNSPSTSISRHSVSPDTSRRAATSSSRRVLEIISATAGLIGPVLSAPKELVKSAVRPHYWQPDEECVNCAVCKRAFGARLSIHHCRMCGKGVCGPCSAHQKPVPQRGLDWPSRGSENTLRILLTTDNHVGYLEKDGIRGNDTFKSLEEILCLAKRHNVDFILQGGDLFHESRPSIRCINEVLRLVRTYCFNDRSVSFEVLSDPTVNFSATSYPGVNYLDPNLNVGIPVFAIHGNHDDPSGPGNVCPPDLLHTCGFLNLLGKSNSVESMEVNPVLIRKGSTNLALYGIGAVREERLHRLFRDNKVTFLRPEYDVDNWFSLTVVHQNRVRHGPTGYLPEKFLPSFLDLVFWGHEHDCRIIPEWNESQQFYVVQPGSSVITSLCEGEAIPKCVGLLEIQGRKFNVTKLPLQSVRKLFFEDIILQDELSNVDSSSPDAVSMVEKLCNDRVQAAIDRMTEETSAALRKRRLKAEEDEEVEDIKFLPPPEPLVRLRVDTSGGFEKFSAVRFGQKFVGHVANPKDLITFHNRRDATLRRDATNGVAVSQSAAGSSAIRVGLAVADVETLISTVLSSDPNLKLELLTEVEMASALRRFVGRSENDAIGSLVEKVITKTQGHLTKRWCLEEVIPVEISRFAEIRKKELSTVDVTGTKEPLKKEDIVPVKDEPMDVTVSVRAAPSSGKQLKQSTISFGFSSSNDGGGSENDEENRLLLESLEMVESQVEAMDNDASDTRSRFSSGIFSSSENQTLSSTLRRGTRSRRGRGSCGARRGTTRRGRGATSVLASMDDVEVIQIDSE
nr:double strand break repair protein MRE11A [Hymenolepis microstoma]